MTYVKTYLPTLKTHVVNLKREAKDLSRDLQRLEVRGKLESKTLYWFVSAPNATYYKSDSIDSGPISELFLASLYQSMVAAQSFI